MKIMLADDDEGIRVLVSHIIKDAGYDFCVAVDGLEAIEQYKAERPDVLILDVMMPGLNGFDVCKRLRDEKVTVPIIVLTAKGDIVDKSVGFKAGADDYLVKPFVSEELLLRIEALLRRSGKVMTEGYISDRLQFDGMEIDVKRRRVEVAGVVANLTPKEFHLLHLLASNPGIVFTKDQLIEDIWGAHYEGEMAGITVLVHRLREKIEADPSNPRYVHTVWHVGYRFGD
ncbi:MAG: response regulator transcription factor [Gordonibacter sp.]|uniref:response regulator transcription factor n=1 Tax=Gordonibacter sp. TaxID=1968902 RepID=UPI002FC986D6